MSDRSKRAMACFKDGFNCAQAVISTCGPEMGLDRETALRIAGGFGGGMGYLSETCGAVTGAFMAIGLKHAKTREGEDAERDEANRLVQAFAVAFKARHGTLLCRELTGFDISTPEGLGQAREAKAFEHCASFVQDAVEILQELGVLE